MDNKRNRFALDAMDLEFANEILEDNGYSELKLTSKRKMILATLLYINGIDEKNEQGYFFVENSYLCQLIGISEPALIESLKYLNSVGIISRISGKRGSASLYRIEKTLVKNFSNKSENFSNNLSKNFSNKSVDNQAVRELRYENLSNNFSNKLKNFSNNLSENFSTDIEEDKDLEIDKEIELKKDINKNNIYNIKIINILNKINNNIIDIKEKNNKKEKEIEEIALKLEALNMKVDNFEINMKKENKENTTATPPELELIITKLNSIEERITSIEEEIKSLKGQNCAVTASNEVSNIITPIEEDNAAEAKEMASEAIHINPTEIAKAVFAQKDEEKENKIEKRSIPTFVPCEVKLKSKDIKKYTESPTKAFASDLTAHNTSTGVIVPQEENKPTERKKISDEEWKAICEKNARKENTSTRDVMGSFVPCASNDEGWIDGVKQFKSMKEIDAEIAVWKRKGLDIMQIATRFKVNKETFTMTDKLYTPSKVSNQVEANVKKEIINTPSEVNKEVNNTPNQSIEKVDKVAEILAKVNKDTEKEVVEEVHKNTEENVYYAKTNTARFEYENDDFTSTEAALDNIFSSDYSEEETKPYNALMNELEKRKQEAVVEAPF